MKYILAIDSFKGCLTSAEAELAAAEAIKLTGEESQSLPMSDGGDGMLEAFLPALDGWKVTAPTHDPLMRPIKADYGMTPHGTAIIEVARTSGLTLMRPEERNPLVATSYGTGEQIVHVWRQGCRRFIIGLGGSGTSDAGIGMLKALVDGLAPGQTTDAVRSLLRGCQFTLASDVRNPLCGTDGAASVYGPQKGATPAMVAQLDNRACRFARYSARHFGYDRSVCPGAGAAGGLGYAFLQYLDAAFQPGADLLLQLTDFDHLLTTADCVITGEGSADRQTLMGKLPERVLAHAKRCQVPVWLIAGRVDDTEALTAAGFSRVACINPPDTSLAEALRPDVARRHINQTVSRLLRMHQMDANDC